MTAEELTSGRLRFADPETAFQDAREVHAYLTAELANATDPGRVYNLTQERKRLAGIWWAIKRKYRL